MNYGRGNAGNVDAIRSDGVVFAHDDTVDGCTLGVGTYYFPIGSTDAPLPSNVELIAAHLQWAAAVAATITVEDSNFPRYKGHSNQGGPEDTLDYSSTAGDWIQENPSTAIVATAGSGNSSVAATVTAGGTNAGGCMYHLGNAGSKRWRIKVVTTVGGVVRCGVHGKLGA